MNSNEILKEYYIETDLRFEYELRDGGKTSENVSIGIRAETIDNIIYSVEDAYRIEDESEI